VPHLVAAPDKFRGTASAAAVAAAVGRAGRAGGWVVDELPLADGGEGTAEAVLYAVGTGRSTETRHNRVSGPLGHMVEAEWWVLHDTSGIPLPPPLVAGADPTAVIEAAQAAGRALLPAPTGDEPVRASTAGVGQLVLAAVDAGARQVVVAVGGSATTDGGLGAVGVIGSSDRLRTVRLVVACDVTTPFSDAASVFGPQKGASPAQVAELSDRLRSLEATYRAAYGVDVGSLAGAGAAGGLAGGLAALGAHLVGGFALVATVTRLEGRLAGADLVVTGEGRLDTTSFEGKVVGGVLDMARGRLPALCVVGQAAPGMAEVVAARTPAVAVASLVDEVGPRRAWNDTVGAVAEVVARRLALIGPAGSARSEGPADGARRRRPHHR
jgi:glycerate 2-kinase